MDADDDRRYVRVPETVPVASKPTLIRTKQTLRPSDHRDVAYLEALLRSEEL